MSFTSSKLSPTAYIEEEGARNFSKSHHLHVEGEIFPSLTDHLSQETLEFFQVSQAIYKKKPSEFFRYTGLE